MHRNNIASSSENISLWWYFWSNGRTYVVHGWFGLWETSSGIISGILPESMVTWTTTLFVLYHYIISYQLYPLIAPRSADSIDSIHMFFWNNPHFCWLNGNCLLDKNTSNCCCLNPRFWWLTPPFVCQQTTTICLSYTLCLFNIAMESHYFW